MICSPLQRLSLIFIVLAAASTSMHARAQSFKCSLAPSTDEALICQDSDLRRLDERLASLYFELRNGLAGADQRDLERKQREWLKTRRSCGQDRACVEQAYLSRIDQLAGQGVIPSNGTLPNSEPRKMEPRKVKTVAVRGDQPASAAVPASPAPPSPEEGQQATPSRKIEQRFGAEGQQATPSRQQTPSVAPQPSPPQAAKRIPLRLSGNNYVVPVLINRRIWLDFVIDTGASDVSIPADVGMTLIRTETITEKDIVGEQSYGLADGRTVKDTRFRIHSLQVGKGDDAVIAHNVDGSIGGPQGSLLLGQSFLRLFRSTTIDHENRVLIIDGSEPQPLVPTALQPAPTTALQPAHPANAQRGPISPPPVPQYFCDRSPLAPPLALVMGEYVVAWRRACMEQFNMKMQIWRAELYRIQILNQQRGY